MKTFQDNDNFDKRLRNLTSNAESELPQGSWERLKLKRAEIKNRKKIKFTIFFSSMIVLIITASFILYNYYHNLPAGDMTSQNNSAVIKTSGNSTSVNSNTEKHLADNSNKAEMKNQETNKPTLNKKIDQIVKPEKSEYSLQDKLNSTNEKQEIKNKNENSVQNVKNEIPISDNTNTIAEETKITEQNNGQTTIKTVDSTKTIASTDSSATKFISFNDSANITLSENPHDKRDDPFHDYAKNEFHITPVYNYNITWIMNQNTYGQFNGMELAYKMDYGSAYGIMAGYDVARKYGFQTGILFNSTQGEKYHDVLSIGEFTREINLKYMHIPLAFKLKSYIYDSEFPIILNFVIGGQYGILKSAEEVMNGQNTDIKDRFKKNELSILFNVEGDIYLNNSFYLTFGLNSSLSNDINAKDWPVNDDYGKSHNMLTGLVFGLNYYFPVY